jgi:hypothetical protein
MQIENRISFGRLFGVTSEQSLKCKIIPVQAVEALRVARGLGSHIFRHSANRWWQGCQPYAPAAFYPPGRFLVLISVRG